MPQDACPERMKPLPLVHASVLALISGILLIIPFLFESMYLITLVALVPLLIAIHMQKLIHAVLLGFVTGFCVHFIGLYWLVGTMMLFGGIALPVSIIFYFLITIAFGTLLIPFTVALNLANSRAITKALGGSLFIAAAYTASEFVFPSVFPWRLGYPLVNVPQLVQVADLGGPYLVSFMVVLGNAVLFQVLVALRNLTRDFPWAGIAAVFAVFTVAAVYGHYRLGSVRDILDTAPKQRIALLQPNVDIREKFITELGPRHTQQLFDMSLAAAGNDATLIIWPETGYRNLYWSEREDITLPPAFPDNTWLFVGVNIIEDDENGFRYYNSSLALNNNGDVLGRYDKQRLFPFGEYFPLSNKFPLLKRLGSILRISDFTPGSGAPVLDFPDGTRIGPLICYEDIFPVHSRNAVNLGADILVNITNDAWFTDNSWYTSDPVFGKSTAPRQHLQLARFRTIENRVPMIRATNDSITAVIDATGAIIEQAPVFAESTIIADIAIASIPTLYSRIGDTFVILCLLAVTGVLIYRRTQWSRSRNEH